MLSACQVQGISYSKAWKMVKLAEEQLGLTFLERQTGGSGGGSSSLTEEGRQFIARYRLLTAKPMIISTNLTVEDMLKRYSPQIASRLRGSFERVAFIGEDIRLKKNKGV